VLQLLDVRADDASRLNTFQAQLPVDLLDEIVAQPGHLSAQLRDLVAQHPLHLATDHDSDLLVVPAARNRLPFALREQHVGFVGLATPGAEQREGTQQDTPEADEQTDLNLLLGMPDYDEVNGNTA